MADSVSQFMGVMKKYVITFGSTGSVVLNPSDFCKIYVLCDSFNIYIQYIQIENTLVQKMLHWLPESTVRVWWYQQN